MTTTSNRVVARIEKNAREHVRVSLTTFNNFELVDVRVFAQGDDGDVATRKGISIRVTQLPELISALKDAAELLASEEGRASA